MIQTIKDELRIIWACAKKDICIASTEKVFLFTSFLIPFNYLLLLYFFILPSSQAPTAVVMIDKGPYAQELFTAMSQAHSFRLIATTAQEADAMFKAGKVVSVVTIPANFDGRVQQNQPVQVDVAINNLNTDFTDDIRRAVPLSIMTFSAHAFPRTHNIMSVEHDVYSQDIPFLSYVAVSIMVVGCMVIAVLQSALGTAREWEKRTIKELLLSPVSPWSILFGKMLGAAIMSLVPILGLMLACIGLGAHPRHWFEWGISLLLFLVLFMTIGGILGSIAKQRRLCATLVLCLCVPLFFASGPFQPLGFSTPVIYVVGSLLPLSYAIALLQHACFGIPINALSPVQNGLIIFVFAILAFLVAAFLFRRTTTMIR